VRAIPLLDEPEVVPPREDGVGEELPVAPLAEGVDQLAVPEPTPEDPADAEPAQPVEAMAALTQDEPESVVEPPIDRWEPTTTTQAEADPWERAFGPTPSLDAEPVEEPESAVAVEETEPELAPAVAAALDPWETGPDEPPAPPIDLEPPVQEPISAEPPARPRRWFWQREREEPPEPLPVHEPNADGEAERQEPPEPTAEEEQEEPVEEPAGQNRHDPVPLLVAADPGRPNLRRGRR